MNIFLPYDGIEESVRSLDDLRLNKQILECYQIHEVALGNSQGYVNHPIVKHYAQYPRFVARYGYQCCLEYFNRRNTRHKYFDYFEYHRRGTHIPEKYPFEYFYAEGSKNSPSSIRTYDKDRVLKLYQQKLVKKWTKDISKGKPPQWSNTQPPFFWIDEFQRNALLLGYV